MKPLDFHDMRAARAGCQVDALTDQSPEGVLWTRINTAEAVPGVMTPLTWCYYVYTLEVAAREGFGAIGLVPDYALGCPPEVGDRLVASFHGRYTTSVNCARKLFGGFPGVNPDDVERDMHGGTREGVVDDLYPGRTAAVLLKAPLTLITRRRAAQQARESAQVWWRDTVDGPSLRAGVSSTEALRESFERFREAMALQAWTRLFYQGLITSLKEMAEKVGEPEALASLLSGAAGTEEAIVADELYELALGRGSLDAFLQHHGYHAPNGGDPAARAWREDRTALQRLLPTLADGEPPKERRARAVADRDRVAERLLAKLPASKRGGARLTLKLTPTGARALERTKTTFLIAIDVGRAAARARGAELVAEGKLSDPEDAFLLFADELLLGHDGDLGELAAERRAVRERCLELDLPETWEGQPVPFALKEERPAEDVHRLEGVGGSPGITEGRVRVVLDPAADTVELGEILVCATTDPGWVSLMTVAAALVIDIGAAASHGAIVARELGLPCVIGCRTGTRDLRDGDLVRVDGSLGTVEVLERAQTTSAPSVS